MTDRRLTTALRRDLEDDAIPISAAATGRAVEIAAGIQYHAPKGAVAGSAAESGEGPTASRGREPEDLHVGERQGAVEIAGGIHGQTCGGAGVGGKAVEHGEVPSTAGGAELIRSAAVLKSIHGGGAVEIAGLIEDESAVGNAAIVKVGEGVQNALGPAASSGRQLIDRTFPVLPYIAVVP